MSGFLDKKSRIIDMVLTDYGKDQYAKGKLNFKFYAFSDDEVDYDPWISNSGSMSATELTSSKIDQVENSLVREAVFGMKLGKDRLSKDNTNITNLVYTIPQGQKILSKFSLSPNEQTGSIVAIQQKVEVLRTKNDGSKEVEHVGYDKFKPSKKLFELKVDDFFENKNDGFLVNVFVSSSNGLSEVKHKRDYNNTISYLEDLKVLVDSDTEMRKSETVKIGDLELKRNKIVK